VIPIFRTGFSTILAVHDMPNIDSALTGAEAERKILIAWAHGKKPWRWNSKFGAYELCSEAGVQASPATSNLSCVPFTIHQRRHPSTLSLCLQVLSTASHLGHIKFCVLSIYPGESDIWSCLGWGLRPHILRDGCMVLMYQICLQTADNISRYQMQYTGVKHSASSPCLAPA
jgi:hypothetical protein